MWRCWCSMHDYRSVEGPLHAGVQGLAALLNRRRKREPAFGFRFVGLGFTV